MQDDIYTYISQLLIAVNPFKQIEGALLQARSYRPSLLLPAHDTAAGTRYCCWHMLRLPALVCLPSRTV